MQKKAHGYGDISIRMLKLSSPSIIKPLSIIFQHFSIISRRGAVVIAPALHSTKPELRFYARSNPVRVMSESHKSENL